jgi:TonB family protein
MPLYPQESIKRKAKGVAVAQTMINQEGDVSKVEILEAADSMISMSVTEAVSQWKFPSSRIKDGPSVTKGRLPSILSLTTMEKVESKTPSNTDIYQPL